MSSINLDSQQDHYHGDQLEGSDSYIEGATPSALQPGGDDSSPENSPKAKSPSGDLAKRNNVISLDGAATNSKD